MKISTIVVAQVMADVCDELSSLPSGLTQHTKCVQQHFAKLGAAATRLAAWYFLAWVLLGLVQLCFASLIYILCWQLETLQCLRTCMHRYAGR